MNVKAQTVLQTTSFYICDFFFLADLPFSYAGVFSCSSLLSWNPFKCTKRSFSLIVLPSTTGSIRFPTLFLEIGRPRPTASVLAKSVCCTSSGWVRGPRIRKKKKKGKKGKKRLKKKVFSNEPILFLQRELPSWWFPNFFTGVKSAILSNLQKSE